MSYNQTPRRKFSQKQRAEFFLLHKGICYWCQMKILPGEDFDVEHVVARELMSGKEADADENLRPIHRHSCHKKKTAQDKASIAKSNRIRRQLDPETRRISKHKLPKGRKISSRPFPKK